MMGKDGSILKAVESVLQEIKPMLKKLEPISQQLDEFKQDLRSQKERQDGLEVLVMSINEKYEELNKTLNYKYEQNQKQITKKLGKTLGALKAQYAELLEVIEKNPNVQRVFNKQVETNKQLEANASTLNIKLKDLSDLSNQNRDVLTTLMQIVNELNEGYRSLNDKFDVLATNITTTVDRLTRENQTLKSSVEELKEFYT